MPSGIVPALVSGGQPASIPSPHWSGFSIPLPWGQLEIHAYALCILLGIVVALWVTQVRWKRRGAPAGSLADIAIWAIPAGIIGGRLYHVFSSPDAYFGPHYSGGGDLWLIPQIWRGGLGIWGAVVLGLVGAWIGCRRAGVKLPALMDAAAPGLLLAQGIGRWGNYFNQELFGAPTTLPWGLQIDPSNPNFPQGMAPDTLFHPTFLYESIWDIVFAIVLLLLDKRFHFRRGLLFWLYAMGYTLGRVWIEALRIDDAQHFDIFGISFRLNVLTSILVFVFALIMFIVVGIIGHKRAGQQSVYLPGREPDDAESSVPAEASVEDEAEPAARRGRDAVGRRERVAEQSGADTAAVAVLTRQDEARDDEPVDEEVAEDEARLGVPEAGADEDEPVGNEPAGDEPAQERLGVDEPRESREPKSVAPVRPVDEDADRAENSSAAGNFLIDSSAADRRHNSGSDVTNVHDADAASQDVKQPSDGGSLQANPGGAATKKRRWGKSKKS